MATIKVTFRTPSDSDGEFSLFYRVIHRRVTRQIRSGYRLFPHEWDAVHSAIVFPSDPANERCKYLSSVQLALNEDVGRLENIISRFDCGGISYTADQVIETFLAPDDNTNFISFARNLIVQLKQIGKQCTAETYTTVLNSFSRFRQEKDIFLDNIDSDVMIAYETYLKSEKICPNSTSFYMRNLRAMYNRAVEKGLTVQRFPFKHVYTGIDKTVKRAVPLSVIRMIRDMDLTLHPDLDYARDLFMFSFYTRGMSFVDMAFLKKKDLQNGILVYRRHKTNQQLFIKWEQPMQEILNKYDLTGTSYLLPVIRSTGKDERMQYKCEAHRVNRNLKKIGELLGLTLPLTTYVARHSWGSIAKSKNIPIATISEAMGHDSESTTRIYLASLDTSVVDSANDIILKSL